MTVVNSVPGSTRFRRSGGSWIASVLTLIFVMPFAGSVFVELESGWRLALTPIAIVAILIPLAFSIWSLRSGVDVTTDGLTIKALFGSRRLTWSQLTGFDHHNGKVYAALTSGNRIELPSVRPVDLPRLVAAGGNQLVESDDEAPAEASLSASVSSRPRRCCAGVLPRHNGAAGHRPPDTCSPTGR